MCTAKNVRKLPALRRNPAVVLTIDTEAHPPKALLIRGQAELDAVDGISEEHFQWDRHLPDDARANGQSGRPACGRSTTAWSGRGDPDLGQADRQLFLR
jgi:hypothetical protein